MYVYRFKNLKDEIIYIGKTEDLKSRLDNHNHLPIECYDEINTIEYSIFNNSDEMSIYERYLINIYNPKYNIQYKNNSKFTFELPKLKWDMYIKVKNIEVCKLNKMNVFFRNFVKSIDVLEEKLFFEKLLYLTCNKDISDGIELSKYFKGVSRMFITESLNKYKNYTFIDDRFYYFNNSTLIFEGYKIKNNKLYIRFNWSVKEYLCSPYMGTEAIDTLNYIEANEYLKDILDVSKIEDDVFEKIMSTECKKYIKNGYIKNYTPLNYDNINNRFRISDTINE